MIKTSLVKKEFCCLKKCSYKKHRWEVHCREEVVNSLFQSLNRVRFYAGPGSAKELIKSINEKFAGSAGWEGTESYPLFQCVHGF